MLLSKNVALKNFQVKSVTNKIHFMLCLKVFCHIYIISFCLPLPLKLRKMRSSDKSKILVGLSINLISLLVILIAGLERTKDRDSCRAVSLLLHYFLLSSFCWMACTAYMLFQIIIIVFLSDADHRLLKMAIFSQGMPQ